MTVKFFNGARAQVAVAPSGTTGLSFTLETGGGAKFSPLSPGDWFYGTFLNSAKQRETVKCTVVSGDNITIEAAGRGLDGSTARTWITGDLFYCGLPNIALQELISLGSVDSRVLKTGDTMSGTLSINTGAANVPALQIKADNTIARAIEWANETSQKRWRIGVGTGLQDLNISAFDNAGVTATSVMTIERATGLANFYRGMAIANPSGTGLYIAPPGSGYTGLVVNGGGGSAAISATGGANGDGMVGFPGNGTGVGVRGWAGGGVAGGIFNDGTQDTHIGKKATGGDPPFGVKSPLIIHSDTYVRSGVGKFAMPGSNGYVIRSGGNNGWADIVTHDEAAYGLVRSGKVVAVFGYGAVSNETGFVSGSTDLWNIFIRGATLTAPVDAPPTFTSIAAITGFSLDSGILNFTQSWVPGFPT